MATTPSITLDELVAINDELAGLVRAGVPLDVTLGEVGRDLPGRLGRATVELAGHIERGASLPQALAAMPEAFPPIYRTAVEAGLRAGRLSVVLEDLAQSARRLSELRRVVFLAALYPFIVLIVAIGLFVFFVTKILPVFAAAFEGHQPWSVRMMVELGTAVTTFGPLVEIVLVALAVWWFCSGRSTDTFRWMPVVGRMLRDARLASFSEVLGLLVEHDVPLTEAVPLAADASGDAGLKASARRLAEQLRKGGTTIDGAILPGDLPHFLVWLIGTGHRKELLAPLLEQSADMYRRRALRRSDWIRFYLPAFMTVIIGGVTVLIYTLTLFVPLTDLLNKAATENLLTW